jgi:4-hydroxybenzoate polyprenyltransferase
MRTLDLNTERGWAYLQLMRPANIVTAWADILVGFAASGAVLGLPLVWLLLATTGLYGGGVVFNDVFDAEIDSEERPERPIPSQRSSVQGGTALGVVLLLTGILAASQVSFLSAGIATGVALLALLYDAVAKQSPLFGPLVMGSCRGGNLLLGVSAVPAMVVEQRYLALIPVIYIAAITAISRGEVKGGKTTTGFIALGLIGVAIASIFLLSFLPRYHLLATLPFGILLAVRVIPPFVQATRKPTADYIRMAVKAGVVSLIILDSAIASGFSGIVYGLLVLALLPVSTLLARFFAVT